MGDTPLEAPQLTPSIVVIFGITGDLSQRKLLPALYHLFKEKLLHEQTVILGVTRGNVSAQELLKKTELCVLETNKVCDPAILKLMAEKTQMFQMNLEKGGDYDKLLDKLNTIEADQGVCMNRLYYLSIPPQVYGSIVKHLGEHGLNASCPHGVAMTRLLIEKPFGYDFASAQDLIATMATQFGEEQIYRIDHYLAKETAQNILTFRTENPLFKSVWNKHHISHVDIVASENIGIEGRGAFYDSVGALRDFVQNHLLQLLALTTMEEPPTLTSDEIHAQKLALLESIAPADPDQATRGQYQGYRQEVGQDDSNTETFAKMKLVINNPRWQDVLVTLRTGKNLANKDTSITLTFTDKDLAHANRFRFYVQPNEGIGIELAVKKPGFAAVLEKTGMDFSYQRSFDNTDHPDAYERVLVDAVRGDRTLFMTSPEILAAWRVVEPLIQAWGRDGEGLVTYKPGTDINDL